MRFVPMHERDASGVPLHPVPLTDKDGAARVNELLFVLLILLFLFLDFFASFHLPSFLYLLLIDKINC
jgi:hypothetical protein